MAGASWKFLFYFLLSLSTFFHSLSSLSSRSFLISTLRILVGRSSVCTVVVVGGGRLAGRGALLSELGIQICPAVELYNNSCAHDMYIATPSVVEPCPAPRPSKCRDALAESRGDKRRETVITPSNQVRRAPSSSLPTLFLFGTGNCIL